MAWVFKEVGLEKCRQYSALAVQDCKSADSTALWQCRIAKVQTVQHFGIADVVSKKTLLFNVSLLFCYGKQENLDI